MEGTTTADFTLDICPSRTDTYSYGNDTHDCTNEAHATGGLCEHKVICYCPETENIYTTPAAGSLDESYTY